MNNLPPGIAIDGSLSAMGRRTAWVKDRWDKEEEEAKKAKNQNALLQRFAKTKFKVGEVVLTEQGRRVRIVEVQPKGFISAPRKFDIYGRLGPAVTCEQNIYQYVGQGVESRGQTTEDRLRPID